MLLSIVDPCWLVHEKNQASSSLLICGLSAYFPLGLMIALWKNPNPNPNLTLPEIVFKIQLSAMYSDLLNAISLYSPKFSPAKFFLLYGNNCIEVAAV